MPGADSPTARFRTAARALLAAALLACGAVLAQQPVVVGAVLPQSGVLADLAGGLGKSLQLWQEQVNGAGGLLGRRVELRLLDDASNAGAVGALYERLIGEHRAELLIGPFGSAASLVAAGVAERSRRVLVNATGASRLAHKASPRYVFQVPAPLGAYGIPALELARHLKLRRIFLLSRDDPGARESGAGARDAAPKLGLEVIELVQHAGTASEFAPFIERARAAGAEAWIAFGHPRDAAEMAKSFKLAGYAPPLFIAQGAAEPDFIARVGQDAEGVIGIAPYHRRAATPGNAAFVTAYTAKWSAPPGQVAAEGYAAAKVLEAAVRRAGSVDQEAVRAALAALQTETLLGPHRVDAAGAQLAARPMLVQVQQGRREIVWPEALATAKWQLPYPQWAGRKLLR